MDRRAFVLSALGAAAAPAALAAPAVVGPEYLGVFAGLGPGNRLVDLERQNPAIKTQVRGMGFGGAVSFYEMTGAASPVRFTPATLPPLVVRVASQAQDPMSVIQFFRLQVVKNTRRLVAARVNAMGVGAGTTGNESSVPFNVAKHGTEFFRIAPLAPLSPGEYAVSLTTAQSAFLFGIDP